MRDNGQRVMGCAGAVALVAWGLSASLAFGQSVQPCPTASACAEVQVGSASGAPGGTVSVPLVFKQAPGDGAIGGPDEIAAVALTLQIPGTGGGAVPLRLADCTLDPDGLPAAIERSTAISNFRVVVENAACTAERTHCLCPPAGAGITPDDFINLVIYGPDQLPPPGPSPISIPVLPAGPQELLSIDLRIESGTAPGDIALHVLHEAEDTFRPQFHAFLSVGDQEAVDQTCAPVPGTPPCSNPGSTSQVAISHGLVTVLEASACIGDCNNDQAVTVNEILSMVNIALGNLDPTNCPAGDGNGDNQITVDEILTAVNHALNGCS